MQNLQPWKKTTAFKTAIKIKETLFIMPRDVFVLKTAILHLFQTVASVKLTFGNLQ